LTATSVDGCRTSGWFFVVVGSGGRCGGVPEGVAEEVDGVALEARPDVGIHGCGHSNMSMSQQFLDDDEFDALFEQERGRRVSEIMKTDAAQGGPAEQGVEVSGEGGALDGVAVGPGEDVAARLPDRPRRLALLGLLVAVLFEGVQAFGG